MRSARFPLFTAICLLLLAAPCKKTSSDQPTEWVVRGVSTTIVPLPDFHSFSEIDYLASHVCSLIIQFELPIERVELSYLIYMSRRSIPFQEDVIESFPAPPFIEKQDHPVSHVRSLAIDEAFDFIAQIRRSEAKAHGL
jgi:hypothetical protein